jgi:hypothetical protein
MDSRVDIDVVSMPKSAMAAEAIRASAASFVSRGAD